MTTVRPPEVGEESRAGKQALGQLFSLTSATHDSIGRLFAHFGGLLVERANLKPGQHVLDVASGTGASLVPAAQVLGAGGRVVGTDLAPGMVDRLREVIEDQNIANAEALVADAEDLPFIDESFDAVLCGFGLFFFPEPLRALTEFRRVLRPGGVVALSTFTRSGSASMDGIWRRVGEWMPVPAPAPDEMRYHEPAQLSAALAQAGFTEIEIVESPFELVLPDTNAWLGWLRSMEFREYVDRMDEPALERFLAATAADYAGGPGPELRLRMDALLSKGRRELNRAGATVGATAEAA